MTIWSPGVEFRVHIIADLLFGQSVNKKSTGIIYSFLNLFLICFYVAVLLRAKSFLIYQSSIFSFGKWLLLIWLLFYKNVICFIVTFLKVKSRVLYITCCFPIGFWLIKILFISYCSLSNQPVNIVNYAFSYKEWFSDHTKLLGKSWWVD